MRREENKIRLFCYQVLLLHRVLYHIELLQLDIRSHLKNVFGFRFQVSEKDDRMRILTILNVIRFPTLTPETCIFEREG